MEPTAGEMEKSVPNPESGTICGLLAALSTMTSVPVLLPAVAGEKVTVMVQLPPPGRLVPQLLLGLKSPMLALIEEMASVPLPLVVSVTDCPELVLPTT
jgi:hypothetical protein